MRPALPQSRRRAFTLLETLLALSLLISLMAGVYGIAAGCFDLARASSERRLEEMRVTHLNLLLRRLLGELSAEGRLLAEGSTLRLSPVPAALDWGATDEAHGVELALKNGTLLVAWTKEDGQVLATLPLMPGIESLAWTVRDPLTGDARERWDSAREGLPSLMVLNLATRSGPAPERLAYLPAVTNETAR